MVLIVLILSPRLMLPILVAILMLMILQLWKELASANTANAATGVNADTEDFDSVLVVKLGILQVFLIIIVTKLL